MKKISFLLLSILQLQACMVFVPKVVNDSASTCNTITKKMELDILDTSISSTCDEFHCLSALLAGAAASFVISSSVALVNNEIHWNEYTGKCEAFYNPLEEGQSACIQECDIVKQECHCIN